MRKLIILFLAATLALAACGGETDDPTGMYEMVSIDGNELPYAPAHQGQTGPEIVAGSLTLNADGTFSMTMDFQIPGGTSQISDFEGSYTREGSEFRMQWEGAGVTTGTLEGDEFSFNNEGMIFTFRRSQK